MQKMIWEKKGLMLKPGRFEWMVTHAQNPFWEFIEGDKYKIHFAGRDHRNRARGGFAIIDLNESTVPIIYSEKPTLDLGELGCFDDCGIMPSCLINKDGLQYMYYTGWTQRVRIPFTFFIGLSISHDNGMTFKRISKAPVLGCTHADPYLTASPWVELDNGMFRMWYVSGTGWSVETCDSEPKHFYNIKYAESTDGVVWKNDGVTCIDFEQDEYAIARPTVRIENGLYRMWYCYRGGQKRYRAGYAESKDGIKWERYDDYVGLDVSSDGWDKNMICYPCVINHKDHEYMIYNGNEYGQTGAGLAVRSK